jgi:hypothetical protein
VNLTLFIKFVATLLVGSSLALPASAVGTCLLQSLAARHCEPHCPMTMGTQAEPQITGQLTPGDGSCCQISTAPPVTRNSMFTAQNCERAQINQLESAGLMANLPALVESAFPRAAPPPSGSSHQALICIFLI